MGAQLDNTYGLLRSTTAYGENCSYRKLIITGVAIKLKNLKNYAPHAVM